MKMVKKPFQLDILCAAPIPWAIIKMDQMPTTMLNSSANVLSNSIGVLNGTVFDVNKSPPKTIMDNGQ